LALGRNFRLVTTARPDVRLRRRANLLGQMIAAVVGVGGLLIVVAPVVWSDSARKVLFDPFPNPQPAKTTERVASDGTRTVETDWAHESALDRALDGGGSVLVRLGIVVAAAFVAGAATQRAVVGHFAFELGPLKLTDLPTDAVEASRDGLLEVSAALDAIRSTHVAASLATERALRGLKSTQRLDKESLVRSSQELSERIDHLEEMVIDLGQRGPGGERAPPRPRRQR